MEINYRHPLTEGLVLCWVKGNIINVDLKERDRLTNRIFRSWNRFWNSIFNK